MRSIGLLIAAFQQPSFGGQSRSRLRGMAVACPFCITMFEDGAKGLNQDATFVVHDVAELGAAKLPKSAAGPGPGGESAS